MNKNNASKSIMISQWIVILHPNSIFSAHHSPSKSKHSQTHFIYLFLLLSIHRWASQSNLLKPLRASPALKKMAWGKAPYAPRDIPPFTYIYILEFQWMAPARSQIYLYMYIFTYLYTCMFIYFSFFDICIFVFIYADINIC